MTLPGYGSFYSGCLQGGQQRLDSRAVSRFAAGVGQANQARWRKKMSSRLRPFPQKVDRETERPFNKCEVTPGAGWRGRNEDRETS